MRYYIYKDSLGKIVGHNLTDGVPGSTAIEISKENFEELYDTKFPDEIAVIAPPTPLELTQQDLTTLDLSSIEQGQTITDLELRLLEVQAHV